MGCELGRTMGTCVQRVTPCTSPSVCEFYNEDDMGCTCQECGCQYSVDLSVPDRIWVQISPKKNEAGMLCPTCICNAIAKLRIGDIPARIHGGKGA